MEREEEQTFPRVISLEELDRLTGQIFEPQAPPQQEGPRVLSLDELDALAGNTLVPDVLTTEYFESIEPPTTSFEFGGPNLYEIKEEYNRPFIKEDFLSDPRLQEIMVSSLEARYQPATLAGNVGAAAVGIAGGDVGGLSGRDYRSMDTEDVFETWQNWQRSFAGGQIVTTANELAYGINADDEIKTKLGAGYLLFDAMDNAFTGEGTWAETGDALLDYTKAAVWDPSTLISFGVGKALSFGATKATSTALRSTLIAGYTQAINKGVTNAAARATVGAAVRVAPYTIPDMAISSGVDALYQTQLIEVGVQEEYNRAQTAIAAVGGMVIPALVVGSSGVKALRGTNKYLEGTDLDANLVTLSGKQAMAENTRLVKRNLIVDYVDDTFGRIEGTSKNWLAWKEAKADATGRLSFSDEMSNNLVNQNAFYRYLWLGDDEAGVKGYFTALKDAGFRVTPSMKEEFGTAGTFGQALGFLSDEQANKIITTFEKGAGVNLGITKTSKGLSSHFIHNAENAGRANWINSRLNYLEKASKNTKDIAKELTGEVAEDAADPRRAQFGLSLYKRLLTSSLSTTGTNIKGFGLSTVYNSAADFAVAAINLSQGSYYKFFKGDTDKATKYINRAYGSVLGAARRGSSVFSPDLEIEYAKKLLEFNPKTKAKLFAEIAGDGGYRDALELYDLDKGNILYKGADSITKGAQTLTGGLLQDEITKLWAFGNNVNQAISREYGVSPNEFFRRTDASLEMSSGRFKTNVLEKATFRTMKETASINWSTLPGRGGMRGIAKGISSVSNNAAFGYVLPFGNFMNTNLAVIGDLTGVNAIRFLTKKATGRELDFVTEEGAEALGKAVVGWSAIAMAYSGVGQILGAKERVEQGYTYNQKLKSDGSIEDTQYDGFNAGIQAIAQALAHGLEGRPLSDLASIVDPDEVQSFIDRIPGDVWAQVGVQLGGQIVRDVDDVTRSVQTAASALSNGDLKEVGEILSAFPSRVFQGITRPLEPIDQVYGLFTDQNMNPDLRQGPGNLYNALRYMDNLTGVANELPVRASATGGRISGTDTGKLILGVRGTSEPVLYERMLNAAGISKWNAVNFSAPPEVKNTMDAMAAPLFELYATRYLRANPGYFELGQQQKEDVISQIGSMVSTDVLNQMKNGAVPRSLDLFRVLSGQNQRQVSKILEFMQEDSLEEILEREDSYEALRKVQILLDSYDDIFRGPLTLD